MKKKKILGMLKIAVKELAANGCPNDCYCDTPLRKSLEVCALCWKLWLEKERYRDEAPKRI
jgi:hypothetical protein